MHNSASKHSRPRLFHQQYVRTAPQSTQMPRWPMKRRATQSATLISVARLSTRTDKHWWRLVGALVVALVLGSCKPARVPLTGQAALEIIGPSGSSRIFLLKNGSSRRLTFRGFSPMLSDVEPVGYNLSCQLASNEAVTSLAPIADYAYSPFSPRETTIAVDPGEQLRVAISSEFFERYKGKRCRFSLWFEDSSEIRTQEFVPWPDARRKPHRSPASRLEPKFRPLADSAAPVHRGMRQAPKASASDHPFAASRILEHEKQDVVDGHAMRKSRRHSIASVRWADVVFRVDPQTKDFAQGRNDDGPTGDSRNGARA